MSPLLVGHVHDHDPLEDRDDGATIWIMNAVIPPPPPSRGTSGGGGGAVSTAVRLAKNDTGTAVPLPPSRGVMGGGGEAVIAMVKR